MFEIKTTEFKREYMDDVKYAVIAFSNTDGGKIYKRRKLNLEKIRNAH